MRAKDVTRAPAIRQMRLWLTGHRTQGWLARQLGVSRPTVYRWVQGENSPDPVRRRQVQDLSQGLVQFDDWYTDEEFEAAYQFSPRLYRKKNARREGLDVWE